MKKNLAMLFFIVAMFGIMGFSSYGDLDNDTLKKKLTDIEYDMSQLESKISSLESKQSDSDKKIAVEDEVSTLKNSVR
jgi:peptidoglycan hydrolase CwlO-like protein